MAISWSTGTTTSSSYCKRPLAPPDYLFRDWQSVVTDLLQDITGWAAPHLGQWPVLGVWEWDARLVCCPYREKDLLILFAAHTGRLAIECGVARQGFNQFALQPGARD